MAEFDHKIENSESEKVVVEHMVTLMDTEDEIFCCKYDPTDKYIACGCGDGAVRVFNIHTGKMAFLLGNPKKHEDFLFPVTCLRWRPTSSEMKTKNILVACTADGVVYHWHVTSGKLLHTMEPVEKNQYFCLDYSPDGRHFALGAKDFAIRIIDEHTKSLIETLSGGMGMQGHSNRVFSVKYHEEDPNLLISGGWDNTVLLWDIRSGKVSGSVYGPHMCGDGLDIKGDKILAASYSNDNNLICIDIKKMEVMHTVDWFGEDAKVPEGVKPSSLYGAMYTKDGKHIVAGGTGPNEVRIFRNVDDSENYKVVSSITDLEMACLTLDVANQSGGFAFGCADGYLRIMNMTEV